MNSRMRPAYISLGAPLSFDLMKVKAIKPAFNGRFIAILASGEEIIISRKYVPDLKNKLKEGKV